GTGTISHDLNRWWAKVRGKEDPFAKLGEANDRTTKGNSDYVWALQDINFEIKKGEAVGIIGRNGAGKSTMLKLLSKVTKPTTGNIYVNDRIASLLEVGTGFHPEMTGRENIYLNGAILGMTKKEITRKFDEIVDFSGVERYIDTPVKRYSSGMYVRLAFAVAAHLESEILIVDEVLAVGDAEFQKKCLGKMGDVSKGEGRTVLFVSHNMGSILQLCQQAVLLNKGMVEQTGAASKVVETYYQNSGESFIGVNNSDKDIYLKTVQTVDKNGITSDTFSHSADIHIRITIGVNKFNPIQNIGLCLLSKSKNRVFTVNKSLADFTQGNEKELTVDFIMKGGLIAPMDYSLLVALNNKTGFITYEYREDICPFRIYDDGTELAFAEGMEYGYIIMDDNWEKV
ncbi:MAG: polysaccharide ABC transporter ATP-binding protein, partial [Niabella sp.]